MAHFYEPSSALTEFGKVINIMYIINFQLYINYLDTYNIDNLVV